MTGLDEKAKEQLKQDHTERTYTDLKFKANMTLILN